MNVKEIRSLEQKAIEIRKLILTMIHEAQSGHPGGSLSIADIMSVLYFHEMEIRPDEPDWPSRDRLVLSKGHACPAWYAALMLKGFLSTDHARTLRRMDSLLQGHPDMKKTPGLDMTTGSLGIGAAAAVGMALEAKMIDAEYRVYSIVGDGEMNEGVIWETLQSAVKYSLDNYCMIIDVNGLQLDGPTSEIMPLPDLPATIRSLGWHVVETDGHDIAGIISALDDARSVKGRPSCIFAHTVKGRGVSFMEGMLKWHGTPPNDEEYEQALAEIAGGLS